MPLRRKLMMILLLTAVLPMLAVRAIQAVSIFNLQERVGRDMRERLTREAEAEMLRTVDGYAKLLDDEAIRARVLLELQANEVEHRLAGPVPADHPRVPTVMEFATQARDDPLAVQLVLSERHAVVNDEGQFKPLAISYATQVVLRVNGRRSTAAARDDIARLADMTAVYQHIYKQAEDMILWQYTTLESGLHFSYPGKSGFPAGYSPLQRGWYKQAIQADRTISTPPFIDASTRQLIITFARPVRDPSGEAVGVTAMDLPVSRLLDPADLNSDWAEQARVIVVGPYPPSIRNQEAEQIEIGPDKSFPPDVYIVADVNQRREGRLRLSTTDTVAFDRPEDRKAVSDTLLASAPNGVRRVSIDGKDRMIGFGRIDSHNDARSLYALIIVPTETIYQPAEDAIAQVQSELQDSLVNTGLILLLLLIAVGVVAFLLSFRLTRPIMELVIASRRVAEGSLDAQVDFNRRDELGELGRAFNQMVPALRDRMKIRESLHVAMQVQQSLLPQRPPSVPGLDIAGHSEYCDETGGDYYDFIVLDQLGPDTLAIAVGDVTGHGIAAALLMATGRALIRSHANSNNPLGQVFTTVNHQLCDSEFTGRFMTLMYLIIQSPKHCDLPDGCVRVRYLSAGHDPVIVYRPADDSFHELAGHDIPLGIDADWSFNEEQSDALRPGDILVVGTDGIWECFNDQHQQFGKDRLRDTIRAASSGTAESIAHAISQACQAWRGQCEQADDITLVVVKLLGE